MKVRRGTRWVIGSLVTVVLALVSLTALVITAFVGFVQGIDFDDTDQLTGRAPATVLDVDELPEFEDWYTVDVQFSAAGDQAGDETVVTTFDWPTSADLPEVGDRIEVAYDPADPEHAEDSSRVGSHADVLRDRGPNTDTDTGSGTGAGYAVAGVAGGLALVSLVATIVWATRAPIPEKGSQYPRPYPMPPRYPTPPPYSYPMPPPGYPPQRPPQDPPDTWPKP